MRKILKLLGLVALIVGAAFVHFLVHFVDMQQKYSNDLTEQINIYLQQQTEMLVRLGATLVPVIEQQNYQQVAALLSVYEDISYAPTHQGNVVPFNIQFVSLNAPQQIIGSFGPLDNSHLAPDSEFYSKVVEAPAILNLSKIYAKSEMPNYPMLNLGIGVVDKNDRFYGQLDLKLALVNLRQYLLYRVHKYSEYFDFAFNDQDFTQPKVFMLKIKCGWLLLQYMLWYVLASTVILGLTRLILGLYLKNQQYQKNLLLITQDNTQLKDQLALIQTSQATHFAYGELLDRLPHQQDTILLQALLSDVLAVNAELAQQNKINITTPAQQNINLRIFGNKLKLMQILSGILHEIILQMKSAGNVQVSVKLTEHDHSVQLVSFTFSDNGYYDKLIDREVINSVADVRCKGWANIQQLVSEFGGTLEYSHTVYAGNTICFTARDLVKNNVVSLEAYMQDS